MEKRPFQQHISNEDTAKLPAVLFEGPIVIVDDEKQVEAACRDLASSPVLGFDTETRPSFKAGVTYRVALLQLSTPRAAICSASIGCASRSSSSNCWRTRRF